ncbi:MAG: M48 family metalloprotease [Rhodothermaceae bacterium]|nr:M48 family metalloprotease [Rhodothermaceae bacterium]
MNELFSYTEHPLFDVIGSALLQFIWQGALIAILLALFLILTKKTSPNVRHFVSWLALGVMVALPAISIWQAAPEAMHIAERNELRSVLIDQFHLLDNEGVVARNGASSLEKIPAEAEFVAPSKAEESGFSWAWFPDAKHYFALFWLIGVMVMSLRLAGGCWWIHRLKGSLSHPVPDELHQTFKRLIERAGIRQHVLIKQTTSVASAMLIGWLKPAVLLPMSVVSEMSTDHIEAIMAHELAHVKRYDYLFAGLQAFIETVLFYHPAVWWVSRQIRIEREHCCDDLAVRILDDRARYARALYELEHKRTGLQRLALSIHDGSLLERIRRVAAGSGKNQQSRRMRPSLSSILVAFVLGTSLMLGSCTDFQVESENPVAIGEGYEIPPALESMVANGNRDGIVEFLHEAHNAGDEDALKMIAGVYDRGNEEVRRSLMFVLAHINSPEADQVLIQMVESDPSEEVRYGAIRSITVRIDGIMEDNRFNKENFRSPVVKTGGYTYPSMTVDQEKDVESGLERIALDNTQYTDIREEALIALAHRENGSTFMKEVIRTTEDEYVALKAAGYLDSVEAAASEVTRIFNSTSSQSVRSNALTMFGEIGAMSSVSLLIEFSFEGSTESTRVRRANNEIGFISPEYWAAQMSLQKLYRESGYDSAILSAVEEELKLRLDRIEQDVERGIPSQTSREEALDDIARFISLTSKYRNWVDGTNPLSEYRIRAEVLAARIEQF